MTRRQKRAFEQRPSEDNYSFLARTRRTLRYKDLPRLLELRSGDRPQVEAIQLYANLKMVVWTRALTLATLLLGVCAIAAALITRA